MPREARTDRSSARPPGHARPEITPRRRNAWLGSLPQNPAAHRRHFFGQARVALSRAAPHGGRGLDFRVLGRFRKQPPRQILSTDEGWPEATRGGNQKVGPNFLGHRTGFGSLVGGGRACHSWQKHGVFSETCFSLAVATAIWTRRSAPTSKC